MNNYPPAVQSVMQELGITKIEFRLMTQEETDKKVACKLVNAEDRNKKLNHIAADMLDLAEDNFPRNRSVFSDDFEEHVTWMTCYLVRPSTSTIDIINSLDVSGREVLAATIALHRSTLDPNPPFLSKLHKAFLDLVFGVFPQRFDRPA